MSENAEQPTSSPLTSSAEAFHARMSAQQARALASAVIEAASGTSSCGSSERCGLESLLWKMLPAELLAGLMRCEVTWQGVTMTAYRSRCRRLIAGLGICVSGSFLSELGGLFPIPVVDDSAGNVSQGTDQQYQMLRRDARMLPTPQAFDATNLQRSPEARARAMKKGGCRNLREEVYLLPTPTVNDSKNNGAPSQSRRQSPNLNAVAVPAGGPLNPPWIEWLMGFPIGWTDCEPSEMR